MINKVHIQNIQSYLDTKLEFHPGVNAIIGDSDKGKSAILNSIFWAWKLRPLGDPHRNWNGGIMKCGIHFDNGSVIIKRDKQTEYIVKLPKQKSKSFKASGQSPPQEVTDLFNMDRKINFQRQLERDAPIFLISESPGEVAAFLNRVAGLNKIKETESKGKSDVRETNNKLEVTKEQIKEKQKDIAKYAGIDELYAKVLACVELAEKQAKNDRILNKIQNLLVDIENVQNRIDEIKGKLKVKDKIESALSLIQNIKDNENKEFGLMNKINGINAYQSSLDNLYQKMEIKDKVKEAGKVLLKIDVNNKIIQSLDEPQRQIQFFEARKAESTLKLKAQEKEFHQLMPEQCPFCGSEL